MGETVALEDYAALTNEYDKIDRELKQLRDEYNRLRRHYEQLMNEKNSLQSQIRDCHSNPIKINTLEQEILRLKQNISQLESEKTLLNTKNAQLEDKFIKCKSEAQFINNVNLLDRMDIQNKIKEATKNLENEKENINKLYIDCELKSKEMQKSMDEMTNIINDLKNKNETLQKKIK